MAYATTLQGQRVAPGLWRQMFDILAEARRAQRAVDRLVQPGRPIPDHVARKLNAEIFGAGGARR